MAERRQTARFALAVPMDAHIGVLQDVLIEHAGEDEIFVISPTPGVRGEELTLRIGPSDSVQMTMTVRTLQSEPILSDTRLRYRVRLAISGAIALSNGIDVPANSWRPGDKTTGVFVRRYPVRVLNVSRGGCLLDIGVRLPVGAVGTLHCGDRQSQTEPVRVSYQQERRGGAQRYAVGAEFLSLTAPSSRSLRSMAVRMEAANPAHPAEAGEESGPSLTTSSGGAFDIMAIVCAAQSTFDTFGADLTTEMSQPRSGRALALVGTKTPQAGS